MKTVSAKKEKRNINLKGYKFASFFMKHIYLVPCAYFYDEVFSRKMRLLLYDIQKVGISLT